MTARSKASSPSVTLDPKLVPRRTLEWQEDGEGRVFLLKEKSRNGFMKWLIRKAGKSQYFRIHLDRFGTRAWQLADGGRSIDDIAATMQEEFGAELGDAPARVTRFFTLLAASRFVVFQRPGEPE